MGCNITQSVGVNNYPSSASVFRQMSSVCKGDCEAQQLSDCLERFSLSKKLQSLKGFSIYVLHSVVHKPYNAILL